MWAFAAAWPDEQILQQAVAQLPWGHITVLLGRLNDHELRDWCAGQAVANVWSRNVLEYQLRSEVQLRLRAAPTSFAEVLPPGDSDLMLIGYARVSTSGQGPAAQRDGHNRSVSRIRTSSLTMACRGQLENAQAPERLSPPSLLATPSLSRSSVDLPDRFVTPRTSPTNSPRRALH